MCGGASQEQTDLQSSQAAFYTQLQDEYKTTFGEQQSILSDLTSTFTPILEAGSSQEGFSTEQSNALNSQVINGTGQEFDKAKQAANNQTIAENGGEEGIPQGAQQQNNEKLAEAGAKQTSDQLLAVKQASYDRGYQNWQTAANVLGSTASQYNPNGTASVANTAGSAAGTTADQISSANNAWMGMVGGALGGVAGAATSFGLGKIPK